MEIEPEEEEVGIERSNLNMIFESYEEDLDVNDYLESEYHSSLLQLDQTDSNYQEGEFEVEITNLQWELDEQERAQDEEEAYLRALAASTQVYEAAETMNLEVENP